MVQWDLLIKGTGMSPLGKKRTTGHHEYGNQRRCQSLGSFPRFIIPYRSLKQAESAGVSLPILHTNKWGLV
jgi:hypothetical protein